MSTNDDLIRRLRDLNVEMHRSDNYKAANIAHEAAMALAASAAREAALREVLARCVIGIDHLVELARQWEPDHSSGFDRRGWVLARDASVDARKLLALAAHPSPPASQQEAEPDPFFAVAPAPPEAEAPPKPADWTKPMGLTMDPNAPPLGFAAAPAPQAADAGVTDRVLLKLYCAARDKGSAAAIAAMRAAIALSRTASSADGAGEKA